MTLISSGALALKDNGTNPSSSTIHDTGYNAFSLASDTSFSLHQAYRLFFDGEFNQWEYDVDVLVDGTAYVYKRSSTSAYHDSGHQNNIFSTSGFNADIGTALQLSGTATGNASQTYISGIGLNASSSSTLGSLSASAQTFTSPDGSGRTISDFGMCQNTNSNTGYNTSQDKGNIIWFGLVGQVSNSDTAAFYNLTLYDNNGNGITSLLRSNATYRYDGNVTIWTWHNVVDSNMNSINQSNVTRVILTSASAVTYNNGISEEMSGGTDSNPIEISDYYKDGIYHNTTGIPTSGQIEFSDFYGKARVGAGGTSIHASAWVGEFNWNYVSFSGYNSSTSLGSISSSSFTYPSSTTATIITLYNINNGTTYLTLSGASFPNSGWSNLKIWTNNSTGSGSPTYTLTRSSATASYNTGTSPHQVTWYWSVAHAYAPASIGSTYNNYLVID
jgi:hypothetical protein